MRVEWYTLDTVLFYVARYRKASKKHPKKFDFELAHVFSRLFKLPEI